MIKIIFDDVIERDMDILFAEEFASATDFLSIFAEAVGEKNAKLTSIHVSKTDVALGESDLEIILESRNEKIGFLIEDKIDAKAMPEQAARYIQRGEKGIAVGEYDRYHVFIVAPQRYLDQNEEAHKYPNKISYETIMEYFERDTDARSYFKIRQMNQAINKRKSGYQVIIDKAVTDFWARYAEHQKAHYPELMLLYKGEVKGSNAAWPRFNTVVDGLYMYHKTESGYIDMTLDRCANKLVEVEDLLSHTIGDYLKEGFVVRRTGKAAVIRLTVPKMDVHQVFFEQLNQAEECFKAIRKMSSLAKQMDQNRVIKLLNNK